MNCPHCGAIFSHRPLNSETILWKCGSWQNVAKKLDEQSSRCRIRQLETELRKATEHDKNQGV